MNEKLEMVRRKVEESPISKGDGAETMDSDLKEMLHEFMMALEELRVADEELRNQNEELIAGRQALDEERHRYQELFESQERFRKIFANATLGIALLKADN